MGCWRSKLNKLNRAASLSLSDWWFFIQAWVGLLLIDLSLRLGSFSRTQAAVAKRVMAVPPSTFSPAFDWIEGRRRLVDKAGRYHLLPMTCLRRALALQWLLARRDVPTELCIGARKANGELQAHAWLEFLGSPIGEPERINEEYLPLLPTS